MGILQYYFLNFIKTKFKIEHDLGFKIIEKKLRNCLDYISYSLEKTFFY